MSSGIAIECWGDYACFTRPELKAERYSYDIITPSAARGILEAIYWHPGIRYKIDSIELLSPIKFVSIKRRELQKKINVTEKDYKQMKEGDWSYYPVSNSDYVTLRNSTILKDVHYVIRAHFNIRRTDDGEVSNPGKVLRIFSDRARKGACYHRPYFGCREFPVNFRLVEEGEATNPYPENRFLGLMTYDMFNDDGNISPSYFRAELKNGIMDVSGCEVLS